MPHIYILITAPSLYLCLCMNIMPHQTEPECYMPSFFLGSSVFPVSPVPTQLISFLFNDDAALSDGAVLAVTMEVWNVLIACPLHPQVSH